MLLSRTSTPRKCFALMTQETLTQSLMLLPFSKRLMFLSAITLLALTYRLSKASTPSSTPKPPYSILWFWVGCSSRISLPGTSVRNQSECQVSFMAVTLWSLGGIALVITKVSSVRLLTGHHGPKRWRIIVSRMFTLLVPYSSYLKARVLLTTKSPSALSMT